MMKMYKAALAAASIALLSTPVVAQDEAEEERSTWRIAMIDVSDDGMERWQEIMLDHVVPAYASAGLPVPQLHWTMMNDDYDMIVIVEIPGGMATFDSHNPPARTALWAAMVEQEGSAEAASALFDELDSLEDGSTSTITHSHP